MRKVLVILALLGAAYWWFSKPPAITTRTLLVPAKGQVANAPKGNSVSPNPAPASTPTASQPATERKSPMNSALHIRQTQADRVGRQQKQHQSLP